MLLNISLFKFVSILRCSFQFAKSPQNFLAGNNNLRNFIKIPIRFALGALGWWWFFFAHRQWSWWAACWLLCRIAWARPIGWTRKVWIYFTWKLIFAWGHKTTKWSNLYTLFKLFELSTTLYPLRFFSWFGLNTAWI